jgi:hypothetical protein
MKYLSYLLGFGLVVFSLSACGGSSAAPQTVTSGVTSCSVAGQVSTTQYGCVASQGSCTVPGTSTAGIIYNGTCVQVNNTTNSCSVAGQVSTLQYGCIVPSGGSCTVSGTNAQGVIYNNTCVQLNTNTNGTVCSVGQVQTQYGCVANTGSCIVNGQSGVIYNNTCAPITYNNGGLNNGGYNGGINNGSCSQMVDVIVNGQNFGPQCVTYGACPNGGLYNAQFGCLYPNNSMGGGVGAGFGFSLHI